MLKPSDIQIVTKTRRFTAGLTEFNELVVSDKNLIPGKNDFNMIKLPLEVFNSLHHHFVQQPSELSDLVDIFNEEDITDTDSIDNENPEDIDNNKRNSLSPVSPDEITDITDDEDILSSISIDEDDFIESNGNPEDL